MQDYDKRGHEYIRHDAVRLLFIIFIGPDQYNSHSSIKAAAWIPLAKTKIVATQFFCRRFSEIQENLIRIRPRWIQIRFRIQAVC